jgi:4-amino-4-deoxy-L-arabinose transferase-like glycosyltransferase
MLAFCVVALLVVLRLGVRGILPTAAVAIVAPLALLLPLVKHARRPVFWVVAVGAIVGLPMLGASGLVDPWETHYAEVAREMIERRDFISPWWANDGWFMTKPVLTFWLEALAMRVLGVGTGADQVLAGAAGAVARPEWAVRFPGFALMLLGSVVLYDGVARTAARRAGLLGAIVLWTMPGFALLSHQAMTDAPLVGCVAAALGCLLRALATNDAALVKRRSFEIRERTFTIHAGHAVAIAIALVIVPQLIVILFQGRLVAGSPHACGLPSQPACAAVAFAHPKLTGALQAALWMIPTLWLVLYAAEETRFARLLALLAWLFASLAAMAKGPVGLVIPAAGVLGYALVKRSLKDLTRLEIAYGLLLAVTMIAPWYLAVYARNGHGFVRELVMRHMLGRTLDHLHDTNEGEDVGIVYFVRQLGYATFPWSGLAVLAMFGGGAERGRRGAARAVLFATALVTFTLVSMMRTKFHHYVLPALPAIAMLVGLTLDELLLRAKHYSRWSLVAASAVTALVARDLVSEHGPARFILLLTYRYSRSWASTAAFTKPLLAIAIVGAGSMAIAAVPRLRRWALRTTFASAVVLAVVLLDLYLPRCSADGGQRDVLATYYRDRTSPAPLVAYQLNWKGENFYSGNNLAIFISSGPPMKTYLDRRHGETVYFVTERGRISGLKRELGAPSSFVELTGPDVSSEFTLVRAVL